MRVKPYFMSLCMILAPVMGWPGLAVADHGATKNGGHPVLETPPAPRAPAETVSPPVSAPSSPATAEVETVFASSEFERKLEQVLHAIHYGERVVEEGSLANRYEVGGEYNF